MKKIVVISSGRYTSFCNSINFFQDISNDLEISIFAPSFNERTAEINSKSLSYFRIEQKPTTATYNMISKTLNCENCLVLVFSKFLIPSSIFSCCSCINFHPSVLPSFPGLSGYKDALSSYHLGFTAHIIDESIDHGPRILSCQITPFPSLNADSIDMISFKMCSLLSAYVVRLFYADRLDSFAYRHYSSSTVDGLEGDMI